MKVVKAITCKSGSLLMLKQDENIKIAFFKMMIIVRRRKRIIIVQINRQREKMNFFNYFLPSASCGI